MKRIALTTLTLLAVATASAEYTVKLPLQSDNGGTLPQGSINIAPMSQPEEWLPISPSNTLWTDVGQSYDCTNWTPDPSTITIGQSFTQTANDCKQDQTRTRQEREQETTSLEIRDAGTPIAESQTITSITTRDAVGTLETWIATTPTYTDWVDSGAIYGCSNWSPDPSTITSGQSFTQTATDCRQDQARSMQEREQETTTLAYRDAGLPLTESQTLQNQSTTRTATGTKPPKVCLYNNTNTNALTYWYKDNSGSLLVTSPYQTIPKMWAMVATAKEYSTNKTIAGLSAVSNTEMSYYDGAKLWKITRGSQKSSSGSTYNYEVCYE